MKTTEPARVPLRRRRACRYSVRMSRMKSLKSAVKTRARSLRRAIFGRFFAFDAQALQARLAQLGLARGDVVLVHSSFDAFEGFQGKPNDVIQALQAAVGAEGLLLMPTMGFTGSAIDFARSGQVFDARRSPSRMGLVSELFRRTAGVVRSVHPTHAVACWGQGAAEAAQGHHLSTTPCGRGSPFEALLRRDGKILLLGTDISVLTFYHYLEELFEARFPESPFTEEVFTLVSKNMQAELLETRTRLYAPALSKRRNLHKLVPHLKRLGAWREGRIGRLRIAVLQASGVEKAVGEMIQQGVYCYD
ncbi:AAC(3) family N-acetyltransferase [Roseateles sp.]|uniref:AAC(3) family N-acetyltransferase n=1 Tax=Roseateles sp. TaxID=1971397 RepID=UPI0039E7D6EC